MQEISQQILWNDTMWVIIGGAGSSVVSELIQWVLIYSKDEYKELKKQIEQSHSKLEKQKEQFISKARQKQQEKKNNQVENQYKRVNQEMSSYRFMSTLIVGFFMLIFISSLNTVFQGIVVAILPFEPFSLLQGITHRGLIGNDISECCHIYIYILTSFIVRANLQKICGFEPPKGHQTFYIDQSQFKS